MAQGQQLIWGTAKTRGQPPQGSALEPLGEQPESSASLCVCGPWGPVCCRLGLLLPQRMDDTIWLTVDFFYFFTLLSSNPCFQPLPLSRPLWKWFPRGVCWKQTEQITAAPNNCCLSGRDPACVERESPGSQSKHCRQVLWARALWTTICQNSAHSCRQRSRHKLWNKWHKGGLIEGASAYWWAVDQRELGLLSVHFFAKSL